jgi:hypothetical protein
MFLIAVTGPDGWVPIIDYLPASNVTDEKTPLGQLSIQLTLAPDMPPLVGYDPLIHGENHQTQLPMVRFLINPTEEAYPYDLLQKLLQRQIRLDVDASGCMNLVIHNQIGRLSTVAAFAPFGPLPDASSYLLIGCRELMTKQLHSIQARIVWSGIPPNTPDLQTWYAGYAQPPTNQELKAEVRVLADGRWHPGNGEPVPTARLFHSQIEQGQARGIAAETTIPFGTAAGAFKPVDIGKFKQELAYIPGCKNGFFMLSLAGSAGAFGHVEYPQLLTRTLVHNAMVKSALLARPIPNPPYTPMIESLKLDYSAGSVFSVDRAPAMPGDPYHRKMIHLHPFGWSNAFASRRSGIPLVPLLETPGAFFIGIKSPKPFLSITLFFHLNRDSEPIAAEHKPNLRWWSLGSGGWDPLAKRNILRDTTNGFMTSGMVSLEIPDTLALEQTLMPEGLYWLKITAESCLSHFCRVFTVFAQALQVTRKTGVEAARLPPGSISRIQRAIPGLSGIFQLEETWGGRKAETEARMQTRLAERLRHKNRALTPQDYERLILEAFPDVFKVKCFSATRIRLANRPCPGHVLIVPIARLSGPGGRAHPHLGGHMLQGMQSFLRSLTPGVAKVSVANPVFEKIQVRCGVKFRSGFSEGKMLRELNDRIGEFISPWHPIGYTRHFGWHVSEHEIRAYIQNLPYVESVTDFSLLKILPRHGHLFGLDDSESTPEGGASHGSFTGRFPWSVAVPMHRHYINPLKTNDPIHAELTGYGELEIGSTFIIKARESDG